MTRAVLALSLAATGCKEPSTAPAPAPAIPHIAAPIAIDGEWTEPDWSARALRGQFVGEDGQLARPSSEARFLRDASTLYVGLYAADDDIRSSDAFELDIGSHAWTITATGEVRPPIAGAKIAFDRDGTLDDATNNDEEWVIELAVPLSAAGAHGRVHVRASRCDTPKHQAQRCGQWAKELDFE